MMELSLEICSLKVLRWVKWCKERLKEIKKFFCSNDNTKFVELEWQKFDNNAENFFIFKTF